MCRWTELRNLHDLLSSLPCFCFITAKREQKSTEIAKTRHCVSMYKVIYTIIGMKDHIQPSRSNLTPPKDLGHMIFYTPNQCPYQVSTSYTLRFLRYSPDKILQIKVTTERSKVKSRSYHDAANLHPQPMPYQESTSYTLLFPRYSPDKIL